MLLAAIVCAVFFDVAAGESAFVRRDIARFYYPMWRCGSDWMASGIFPLWNPLNNFGCAFFANVQTCVLYPPSLLFYAGDFAAGFGRFVLLHLFLAAWFTYLWMRETGASREASFLSGAAFAFGGWGLSTLNLTISLASSAYFPLVLLCLRRALGASALWAALCALALVLQFLAGDPAVLAGTMLVLWAACAYAAVARSARERALRAGPIWTAARITAIFLGLAAFQLLPFLELVSGSIRSLMGRGEALMWSMQYNDLVGIVVPFFTDLSMYVMDYWTRQSWLENYYAGISIAGLAGLGLMLSSRRNTVGYLALLVLAGIGLALGRFSALYPLLREVLPPLGLVRYPVRFYFLAAFGLACLAGHGLDALAGRAPGASRAAVGTLALGLVCAVIAIGWSLGFDRIESGVWEWARERWGEAVKPHYAVQELRGFVLAALSNSRRSLFLLAVCLLGAAGALRRGVRRPVLAGFFGGLVLLDLGSANLIEPRVPPGTIEAPTGNVERVLADPGLYRVMASPRTVYRQTYTTLKAVEATQEDQKEQLTSNFLMLHGIQDALGYDSVYAKDTSRIQAALMELKDPVGVRILDWLNIRYLASPKDPLEGFELVRRSEAAHLYINPRALPRAFVAASANVEPDREKLLQRILSEQYDPLQSVWIDDALAAEARLGRAAGAGPPGPVEVAAYGPGRVELAMPDEAGGWLFLSDSYAPGWRVSIDGRPAPARRANYAFRAVYVPPGGSRVVWEYMPASFAAGVAASILTLGGLLCWLAAPGSLSFARPSSRMNA